MALANCVQVLLCGLSAAVRNALVALLQGYIAQLGLVVATLKAQLIYLNILTAPVKIADDAVTGVITKVRAAANLVPLSLIGQCVDIGDLNVSIQQNLDVVLADATIIANDLERLLSFGDEIAAKIQSFENTIQFYEQVIATINVCPQL